MRKDTFAISQTVSMEQRRCENRDTGNSVKLSSVDHKIAIHIKLATVVVVHNSV